MRGRTIVIDGRKYDAATGVPADATRSAHVPQRPRRTMNDVVSARSERQRPAQKVKVTTPDTSTHLSDASAKRQRTPATHIHSAPQRSQTLHRSALKKPESKHAGESKRQRAIVAKSPHITKFAPQTPHATQTTKKHDTSEAAPKPHPTVAKLTQKKHATTQSKTPISSRAIKEKLIKDQLETANTSRQYSDHKVQKKLGKKGRFTTLVTASLALILFGGYLTYLNMPGLSIRVAAAQAGVEASMPGYHPDGYRFNGPITFTNGQVTLNYSANGGPHDYSLTQQSSDWDSQAVLDNYVLAASGEKYNIHSTQGLTVYTFKNKAVWVNQGVLHEVDYGNAPLSYTQIERIAASM